MLTNYNSWRMEKTIDFLRFPLIVLVVFIHAYLGESVVNSLVYSDGRLYLTITKAISLIIARIAVPLFFFISGFLFFYKIKAFSFSLFLDKLKRRTYTLLIPYLMWNSIGIGLTIISQILIPDVLPNKKNLLTYSWNEWIWMFYDTTQIDNNEIGHFPICNQLWFIRDLMIVILFSPIIYYCLTKFKYLFVIFLAICWFFNLWLPIVGFSSISFLFFSAGAIFSIMKLDFVDIFRRKFFFVVPILYAALILLLLSTNNSNQYYEFYQKITIVVGIISTIIGVNILLQNKLVKTNSFLSKSSFFIYAYHSMVLVAVTKIAFHIITPQDEIQLLFLYFFCPILTIGIGLLLYYSTERFIPKIASTLTGNR